MSRPKLSSVLFWSIASLSALLLVFLVLVIGGVVRIDSPADPAPTEPEAARPGAPTTAAATSLKATTSASTVPKNPTTVVVLTAARGDSWFSARVSSQAGRVLAERVLSRGESATFRARRIWLSVGASGNVDLTVNGEPTTLPPGTVSVVLTPSRA